MRPRYTVLVCGGRTYANAAHVNAILSLFGVERLVHGDADGADKLAKAWARSRGIPEDPYPIQRPGENGFDRNTRMLKERREHLNMVLAFPGGNGTADMVRKARAAGVPTIEVPDAP